MIGRLKSLLSPLLAERDDQGTEDELDLAVAVLLVEMARADHRLDATEEHEIQAQLEQGFGLQSGPAAGLLSRAREAVENAVSLHEFTRAIHASMDYAEKQRVIEMLWRVALADRSLDKYEDYLIGKLGELLYVSRGDVIRLKNQVMDQLRARDG